jgi:protein disulfide-isomerase
MKLKSLFAAIAALTLTFSAQAKETVQITGAELGKWTMDAPAAMQLAKETGKPVFICFTGSDWCGWCKLMDRQVFSTDTWKNYAKDNVVTLWIDFPKQKSLVPDELRPQNDELAKTYKIDGFPTYIIVDAEGTEIGRLGASNTATPEAFIEEYEATVIATQIDTILSAEDVAAYKALKVENDELFTLAEERQEAFRKEMEAIGKKVEANNEKIKQYLKKAVKASK